jgi:hypothetical protein
VINCENANPPTTATPSGRRDSEPAPVDIAIGNVPINAAIVVIMIGRNRIKHACTIASAGARPAPLRLEREVDHHDRVLSRGRRENGIPTNANALADLEDQQREQRAERREWKARQDRDRMMKPRTTPEHDVNHEDRHAEEGDSPR